MRTHLSRYAWPISVAIGAAMGACVAWQLRGFHVPALLLLSCALAMFAAVAECVHRLMPAPRIVTHRCSAPGCDFSVRLTNASGAEDRRWREMAADHPQHRLDPQA